MHPQSFSRVPGKIWGQTPTFSLAKGCTLSLSHSNKNERKGHSDINLSITNSCRCSQINLIMVYETGSQRTVLDLLSKNEGIWNIDYGKPAFSYWANTVSVWFLSFYISNDVQNKCVDTRGKSDLAFSLYKVLNVISFHFLFAHHYMSTHSIILLYYNAKAKRKQINKMHAQEEASPCKQLTIFQGQKPVFESYNVSHGWVKSFSPHIFGLQPPLPSYQQTNGDEFWKLQSNNMRNVHLAHSWLIAKKVRG